MVEKARRAEVQERRPDADPAWEIFARDDEGDQVRYVGAVRAETATDAHAEATRLSCWSAHEVWVCPVDAVQRFSADADAVASDGEGECGDNPALATPESGDEERIQNPECR